MKLRRVLYGVPLLLVSVGFAVVLVRFKQGQRRAQATRELVQLCYSGKQDKSATQSAVSLLREGADPNVLSLDTTLTRQSLLCVASVPLARELLAAGAKVDERDNRGWTPLMSVAQRYAPEYAERARVLLQHGADPNAHDKSGDTPLFIASQACGNDGEDCGINAEIARMLLAKGARVTVCDAQGDTPLSKVVGMVCDDEATRDNSLEFVRLLLAYGADPLHRNKKGETPLSLLRQQHADAPDDHSIRRALAMLQNAIKQRKRVKSPRT